MKDAVSLLRHPHSLRRNPLILVRLYRVSVALLTDKFADGRLQAERQSRLSSHRGAFKIQPEGASSIAFTSERQMYRERIAKSFWFRRLQ